MRMRKTVYLLLAFFICLVIGMPAWAETVQGVVRSGETTLANRQVYIGDNQAQTDRYGNFVMWLDPGIHRVHIQGFKDCKPRKIRVRPGQRRTVEIQVFQEVK